MHSNKYSDNISSAKEFDNSDHSKTDKSNKISLKKRLEHLLLGAALTLTATTLAATFNPIYAQNDAQTKTENAIEKHMYDARMQKNVINMDTCDCPPRYKGDCPPKYGELNFLKESGKSTFSAKEMWTLDKGNGVDLLALYCDSSNIHNLLELMDFKDKTIKNNILSKNYTTIEDNANREYMEIETKNGTRYFTIQTKDKENKDMIGIDGTINYDMLKDHGNKMLRLYVQVGKYSGIDVKTGRIKVRSLDSGDLIIPYYDCSQSSISSDSDTIRISSASNNITNNIITNVFNNVDNSTKINITFMDNKTKEKEDTLKSERLRVSAFGGIFSDAAQKKFYECGEFDINTVPLIWKLTAYAKTQNNLYINTEFTHLNADAALLDSSRNNIGNYGITSDDLLLDVRFKASKSSNLGMGFGSILEYNASTQKGNLQQYSLDTTSARISGLLGIILFADDKNVSFNAGVYAGYSNELGTLFNATARINNIDIGRILDINSRLFFETYNGDYGRGNRAGLEAYLSGPILFGFLRPTIGYEIIETIYSGNNSHPETGLRKSILVGLTADFGRTHKSSK